MVGLMTSIVDALLFGAIGKTVKAIYKVLEGFNVQKVQEGELKFCGKEMKQSDD